MARKKREHPLALHVTFTEKRPQYDGDRLTYNATFSLVEVHPAENRCLFGASESGRPQSRHGLTIRNLGGAWNEDGLEGLETGVSVSLEYGFSYNDLLYPQMYYVRLREVQAKAKALGALEKRLRVIQDEEGSPSTPGDYLVQFLRALGIRGLRAVVFTRDRVTHGWGSYDEHTYQFVGAGTAKFEVNRAFSKWLKEQNQDALTEDSQRALARVA